jgi:hypothetical protein
MGASIWLASAAAARVALPSPWGPQATPSQRAMLRSLPLVGPAAAVNSVVRSLDGDCIVGRDPALSPGCLALAAAVAFFVVAFLVQTCAIRLGH